VARGDLTQQITVEAKGEVAALAETINTMVDQLSSFADEVTRVAKEVGTEGILGGQADVKGVAGTWKELTDSVKFMAGNLASHVRRGHVGDAGRPVPQHHGRGARRGRRPEGQRQPDDREPPRDHAEERRAGLVEDQPRPHQWIDAGPTRPARGVQAADERADS